MATPKRFLLRLDPRLFDAWTAAWDDLVAFEIVPVISSAEAAARATG